MTAKRPISVDGEGLGWQEIDPSEDETEVGDISAGSAGEGAVVALGRGLPYTEGMVVLTTDNTATSTTEGGNITDVSAAAASESGSTFSFQGASANHTIIIGSEVDDVILLEKVKHYGIEVLQTTAASEVTPRSFVFEYWNGTQWTEVYNFSHSMPEAYRYANEVFIRANSHELISYGIGTETSWTKKVITAIGWGSGKNLFWIRIRIVTTVTTAPVFEQFKLVPSGSVGITRDGLLALLGLAKYRTTIQSAGNVWGESGGVTSGNVPLGTGGLPTGWNHEVKNSIMNSNGDALYYQFVLPRGIDTAFPLHFHVTYLTTTTGTGDATCILSVLPLEVAGIMEADPAGGIVPVLRTLANTETRTAKAATYVTKTDVDVSQTDKFNTIEFDGFDISNYYEGDLITIRFEVDDVAGGDLMIMSLEISGVLFTFGERI